MDSRNAGNVHSHVPDAVVWSALALTGAALCLLCWAFAHTDRTLAMRARMLWLFLGAFAVFLLAVLAAWRARPELSPRLVWPILILGIGLRLAVAPVRPATTSDIYRYLWEGRVVRAGMNPYADPPDSPRLQRLRDWVWTLVPFKSVPAAYPPVAQYVFAAAGLLPGNPIIVLKLVLALFDIGTVLLLVSILGPMKLPRSWVILYAWHPLAVCEVVARGHLDSLGIFLMVLAARLLLTPARAGFALSGAALAASILAKGYAVLAAPFMFLAARPRRGTFLLSMTATAALLYAPFASAGLGLFRGASMYAGQWKGNSSVFALVNLALSRVSPHHDTIARVICLSATVIWVVVLVKKASAAPENRALMARLTLLAMIGFFLLSPPVYPWYLAWTLPWLCLSPNAPWLVLTGTIFGFYAHDFAGHHREIWWVTVAEYGLPLFVAALTTLRPRRDP
jgi:hypothetical protein